MKNSMKMGYQGDFQLYTTPEDLVDAWGQSLLSAVMPIVVTKIQNMQRGDGGFTSVLELAHNNLRSSWGMLLKQQAGNGAKSSWVYPKARFEYALRMQLAPYMQSVK